jgi:hypothetical protein
VLDIVVLGLTFVGFSLETWANPRLRRRCQGQASPTEAAREKTRPASDAPPVRLPEQAYAIKRR